MQWMRTNITAGETVMDYGTGSGILAIGALKLGAASADGTDIDPLAVDSSSYNATLNSSDDKFFCTLCDKDGGIVNEKVALRMDNAYYDVMVRLGSLVHICTYHCGMYKFLKHEYVSVARYPWHLGTCYMNMILRRHVRVPHIWLRASLRDGSSWAPFAVLCSGSLCNTAMW
jgi:hypothetical protein